MNSSEICIDITIVYPNCLYTEISYVLVSFQIVFLPFGMTLPVCLYDKEKFGAIEVQYILSDYRLSSEFVSSELSFR